ncbi:armadillo-type protein [Mycena leptocephala]|nr:armadillo-type protein [Mycena leptocephala]
MYPPHSPMFPSPIPPSSAPVKLAEKKLEMQLALPRSPLLDEFRAKRERKWELRDITGFVVEFRMKRQSAFDEIVSDNTLQPMQDVFGNYVIQKLFEHGTQPQKTLLANIMEGPCPSPFVELAIESILPNQQASFVLELKPDILRCVKDSNYNHVIQKVIERVSPDRLGFVSTFIGHVFEPASHSFGCRVLQRCPKHLPDAQTRPLLDELLLNHTAPLMRDQFGNYHSRAENKALVAAKLRGHLLFMARPKFASNVCEKALSYADPEARRLLIDEIMAPLSKPESGYYVLQRALRVAEGDQKEAVTNTIRSQLMNMRRYSNSKHLASIERELEKLTVRTVPITAV